MEGGGGGGGDERVEVMSEVHLGCPPGFNGPSYISHFTFPLPSSIGKYSHQLQQEASSSQKLSLDEDGDLDLTRRNMVHNRVQYADQLHAKDTSNQEGCLSCGLTIQHSITSSIPSVGLQVWMAALVLTDFVLHNSFTSSDFDGITALELGAGTGLVGIALALVAKTVFITDIGSDILDNCASNAHLNSNLHKYHKTSVRVKELNWKEPWPPSLQTCDSPYQRSRYSWTSSEIKEAEGATVLLAADVIYSDELTDSFFGILEGLMSRGSEKVLYLALEKRYNFSLDDLDVVANGYAHFRSFLKHEEECSRLDDKCLPCFVGEQMDLAQIPQYIREYERGNHVEIWKIKYCSKKLSVGTAS